MTQVLTPDMSATEWLDLERLVLDHAVDVARYACLTDDQAIKSTGKSMLEDAERELAAHVDDPEGPKVEVGFITVQARNRIRSIASGYATLSGPERLELAQQEALEWIRHGVKGQRNFCALSTKEVDIGGRAHRVLDDTVLDAFGAYDLVHPLRMAVARYNTLDIKKKVRSSPTSSPERETSTVGGANATPT
jgi:hypothetical protein